MTYAEARAYIASLEKRGWRLGLDRMQEFLRLIGNPHEGQKFFHVAGTNGKGTVTAMIASILKAAGYRTGAFFSPYVYDFRERIQINGEMIPEEDIARLTECLMPVSEEMASTEFGGPTEFEFKTAMGFLYWKEQKCDYVALEAGLGGRLDATNVVTPLVSVITEIGLDHQQYLGDTIEEIAREKAGIIKPGVLVVCGATSPVAVSVIQQVAGELCAPFFLNDKVAKTNLHGMFQYLNAGTAWMAIVASKVAVPIPIIEDGLRNVSLPGRMEVVSRDPLIIFDGAHNAQAMAAVVESLGVEFGVRRARVVYSAATGHDPATTLRELEPIASGTYAAPMAHPRSSSVDVLRAAVGEVYDSVAEALTAAMTDFDADCLLVTGSFFLLAEAKEALAVVPRVNHS